MIGVGIKAPELEYVGTYEAMLEPPLQTGGPFGTRMIFEVIGGGFRAASGDRNGLLMGGGDWLVVDPDGYGRLDVRAQIRTEDGATIYVQYHGVIETNEAVESAMESGATTDFDDHYIRTIPRFETSDPKYARAQQSALCKPGQHHRRAERRVQRVPGQVGRSRLSGMDDRAGLASRSDGRVVGRSRPGCERSRAGPRRWQNYERRE